MNLILEFHNNLTRAKEPGPAACGKPDSPRLSYVELALLMLEQILIFYYNFKKTEYVKSIIQFFIFIIHPIITLIFFQTNLLTKWKIFGISP
ncbi:hypothetical protein B1J94_10505 [Leptospira kirschneri serovar Grippotyphosa]|nr:hypothetical protein B1J94_10505 [Leptospira kirschneri serovar Grippotyphosa]